MTREPLRFDSLGNPLSRVGCPNCGKGRWVGAMEYFAARNSGIDLDAPCSRRCELQLDYAAVLEAERATREAAS